MALEPLYINHEAEYGGPFSSGSTTFFDEYTTAQKNQLTLAVLNAYGSQTTYGVHLTNSMGLTNYGASSPTYFQDTELNSGTVLSNVTNFPSASTSSFGGPTGGPIEAVNVTYSRTTESRTSSATSNLTTGAEVGNDYLASGYASENIFYPVGRDTVTGDIRTMTREELFEIFFKPAIDYVIANPTDLHPGFYQVRADNVPPPPGQTNTDLGMVARDTTANVSGFNNSSIPSAGQTINFSNTTQTDYNLYRGNQISSHYDGIFQNPAPGQPLRPPVLLWRESQAGPDKLYFKAMSVSEWEALIPKAFGWFISNGADLGGTHTDSGRWEYFNINTLPASAYTNANLGYGMENTTLEGYGTSGDYRTYEASTNDYRAVEIPFGSPTVRNTYYLKGAHKEW